MPWQPAFPIERGELEKALLYIAQSSLSDFPQLVPYTAQALIDEAGQGPALALMNTLPGVELLLPSAATQKGPGGRRYRLLCEVMGVEAADAVLRAAGGCLLEVPVCTSLRLEQRRRWARELFDELTGPRFRMSGQEAVAEIGALCAWVGAPAHHRSIEAWLSAPVALRSIGGWGRVLK